MDTVYVTQENSVLHRCAEHLILRKRGERVGTIPLNGVRTFVLASSVQLTTPALDMLFDKSIDVIFISKSGKIKGRLNSASGGGAIVRLAQHSAFVNPEKRLCLAKIIVDAKVKNQLNLIEKNLSHYPLDCYREDKKLITQNLEKLTNAAEIDEVMGIEGICARHYWSAYRQLLKVPLFARREYRPAPDIINSALNLSYSFLATEITTCLSAQKFDLEIGFLHSIRYGRNSLALDIMEEFRSPFADAWLLTLFNKRILSSAHFQGEDAGYYLNNEGFSKFCGLYHVHLENENWRRKFRTQADSLKKHLMEGTEYRPFACE